MEFFNFVTKIFTAMTQFLFTVEFGGIAVGYLLLGAVLVSMFLRFAVGALWESLNGGSN